MTENKMQLIRNSLGGVVGNIMEWYDFAVFGFLAPIITLHFFPNDTPLTGLIMTYGIFATGYMMRPLGGIFFGYIGDKMGRKKALILSIFMMAIPTVLIGFLPTFEQIGIYAAFLLVFLRMIQGLSVGGELIGSVSFMVEIASEKHKGFLGSLTLGSAVGGLLLGSAVVTLLGLFLGDSAMHAWGWRIPFLSGIVILIIGLWLREGMTESPEFLQMNQEKEETSLQHAVMHKKGKILQLGAMISLTTIASYVMFVWMPTYLSTIIKHPLHDALAINTFAMIVLFVTIPLAGYLSDIVGQRKLMIWSTWAMLLSVWPLFALLQRGEWYAALSAQILFALIVGFLQGPMPSLMAEMFPVKIRYTSIGIGYNFSVALLGGTAPIIATWLIEKTGNPLSPSYYIMFFAVVSLIALIRYESK
jgi:MHS family proline/betaine transporter-like MFS transporter